MLDLIKKESNKTYTENGALTNRSPMSDCVDLFATIGALRNQSDAEIISRFIKAYAEDRDIAMKILFFARDVRGGLGERRTFRAILRWLALNSTGSVLKNMEYIAEFGRYDDILTLLGTPCETAVIDLISRQLGEDIENCNNGNSVSLLAKWLPSVNASNKETVLMGKKIAKALRMADAEYRKMTSRLRKQINIIENNLREKDYTFDYEKQASKALFKYRKAFICNDNERYCEYLESIVHGDAEMKTSSLTPYDIIKPIYGNSWENWTVEVSDEERMSIDAAWNSLEDFTKGENAIAVIDISGSMYWGQNALPACIAHSLGIYYAERNKGAFANHFITFSRTPQLIELKGDDIVDKVNYVTTFNEYGNTDLMSVFNLILNAAVANKVPQSELPSKLYIVSDMEFDNCVEGASKTNFQHAKEMFKANGYILPNVVFWNVESRNKQQPITINDSGAALVSGYSPRLFGMVTEGDLSPYRVMMDVIGNERYAMIVA